MNSIKINKLNKLSNRIYEFDVTIINNKLGEADPLIVEANDGKKYVFYVIELLSENGDPITVARQGQTVTVRAIGPSNMPISTIKQTLTVEDLDLDIRLDKNIIF